LLGWCVSVAKKEQKKELYIQRYWREWARRHPEVRLRLTREEYEELKKLADKANMTIKAFVLDSIRNILKYKKKIVALTAEKQALKLEYEEKLEKLREDYEKQLKNLRDLLGSAMRRNENEKLYLHVLERIVWWSNSELVKSLRCCLGLDENCVCDEYWVRAANPYAPVDLLSRCVKPCKKVR